MRATEFTLKEVANTPYEYELDKDSAQFVDKDGNSYSIKFIPIESSVFAVAFSSGIFADQKTNRHDAFRVFATVIDAIKNYATKNQVAMIVFSANKAEPNRVNLYKKLAIAFTRNSNYKLIEHSKEITDSILKNRIQYLFWYLKTKDFTPFMVVNRKFISENISEKWSQKYKRSINCAHPKGFSQRAHCQGRKKKTKEDIELDEGWKEKLAAAGAAGAMALGGYNYYKQPTQTPTPQPTAQSQAKTIKPITQKPLEKILYNHAVRAGLSGDELAQFMAQCAHETHDWNSLVEYGGSLDFRKYDPKYAPKKAKILGNTKIGDGAKYKGRGYIQITGRYNYTKASQALGIDLVNKPELAQHPDTAAEIALLFWKNRVRPNVGDFQDTTQVTKKINPGLRGLEDRHENYENYLRGTTISQK